MRLQPPFPSFLFPNVVPVKYQHIYVSTIAAVFRYLLLTFPLFSQ